MQRGIEGRKIFLKKQDYSRFVLGLELFNSDNSVTLWNLFARSNRVVFQERLEEFRQETKKSLVELLAFALMPNHFHFIIREIRRGGTSEFMKKMGGYASYFNEQYNRSGALFQSRYKLIPVEDERQLRVLFSYVHTNPVALWEPGWKDFRVRNAKEAFEKLEDYRWSSYRDYIGMPTYPKVTQRDFFLEIFDGEADCKAWIEDWVRFKAENASIVLGPAFLE